MSYLPTAQSTTFPSDGDQQRLRQLIFSRANPKKGTAPPEMSDDDWWSWHGYTYAFRRVFLGDFSQASPVDERGDFYNPDLIGRAERWMRLKYNRPARDLKPAPASGQDAVRTNWKSIPATELTDAERKLAGPLVAKMTAVACEALQDIKRIPREAGDMREPRYRAPPPPPLADADDPRVLEWMRRMEPDEFGP